MKQTQQLQDSPCHSDGAEAAAGLDHPQAERLIPRISELRARAIALEQSHVDHLQGIEPSYQASARNLLHYLALRQIDLRPLQEELTALGLTSLGGCEAQTLSSLDAVLAALHGLAGRPRPRQSPASPLSIDDGTIVLDHHSQLLLGSPAGKRSVRIMVTMPSEAAVDYALVRNLLAAGMDVVRINCAHDDEAAWLGMINNLHRAERELGRSAKIYADLAGPKLRTGMIESLGRVLKYRPRRDLRGSVSEPAQVWLTPGVAPEPAPPGVRFTLPIEGRLIESALAGDVIAFDDCRGKYRELVVSEVRNASCLALSSQTAYVEEGGLARLLRAGEVIAEGDFGPLPEVVSPIELVVGDRLILTRDGIPGRSAVRDAEGRIIEPARISCSLDAAFDAAKPGEVIFFDDGKIGSRVMANDGQEIVVQIGDTGPTTARLRPEKGINLPDTELAIAALTDKDVHDLAFLVKHVDMVGLSFVRTPEDVLLLQRHLERLGGGDIGVVLKVENREAFENLPRLLLTAMYSPPVGVMVARGDLAVEVGFERLAEVQEEILWLCEAAHVPVIWATQVLEGLAKTGAPTRAEVSDAVMSGRAEAVMLNKGPYIVEAVRFLNGVLERMHAHQHKRRNMLRRLSISEQV
ncbi:MAG: pyruvate kinase [Candidatus Accumulibacter phosphatis]|uniref:pyruvate kinase n=1 Tax=Candidatus Accumulibacter phosphatis TaxID=327160 RepID=UPI001A57BF5D|nr:pyruvate kinase [Candidatus Accumulibacter phosphatis]